MRGLFIPDITAEMFRNGCLESIEALMAEGEIYDVDYQQPCEDAISREDAIREIQDKYGDNAVGIDIVDIVAHLPSVRPCREIVEDKRACEKCIHYVTRDSRGVVLCGCDSWECDFEEVKT